MGNQRWIIAAAMVLTCLLPAGAMAHGDTHRNQPSPGDALVLPEAREAQKNVFPGHDGHIMPPAPEDWARYHAAEARLQESRPLFPYRLHQGGRKRHKR